MTMKRRIFYSFHYEPDSWRASQVRNIGTIEGNRPATDNDWETVKRGGDNAIKRWIDEQTRGRSCTVVLVGQNTANRKWINYEIIESWKKGMGVVGIHIHGLKNQYGVASYQGDNPFDYLDYGEYQFSQVVKCYNPPGIGSHQKYSWISRYLSDAIEEAIYIREQYS